MIISAIPLLVLLAILLFGCIYYFRIYGITLTQLGGLLKWNKITIDLKEKSLEELEELLALKSSAEDFESCAEIKNEMDRRAVKGYNRDNLI